VAARSIDLLFGLGVYIGAALTDRIFYDPSWVDDSIAISCAVAGPSCAIVTFDALRYLQKGIR
jgi:hypothetical protein